MSLLLSPCLEGSGIRCWLKVGTVSQDLTPPSREPSEGRSCLLDLSIYHQTKRLAQHVSPKYLLDEAFSKNTSISVTVKSCPNARVGRVDSTLGNARHAVVGTEAQGMCTCVTRN